MPRKSIDSNLSQKENEGTPVKVITKAEKMRRDTRAGPLENGNRQRGEAPDVEQENEGDDYYI